MFSSLESLPPELVEIISDFCTSADEDSLLHLRAASRSLQVATRRKWRNHYFAARKVVLQNTKLEKLREITSHMEYAHTVKQLVISCVRDAELSACRPSQVLLESTMQDLRNLKMIEFIPASGPLEDEERDDACDFDFSNTFGLILSAVQASGLRPRTLLQSILKSTTSTFSSPRTMSPLMLLMSSAT